MSSIHARLSKLERRIGPEEPAVHYELVPEMRELRQELIPIVEQSSAMRKLQEDAKAAGGPTREMRHQFWGELRELLRPYPALHQRVGEALRLQIQANAAVEANNSPNTGQRSVW